MRQCLELARLDQRVQEGQKEVKSVTYRDGRTERF